jgi:hypothetical protein
MVPMPLGLIDEPSMTHNLVSAQESLVPLPKFQMAPRLKIVMSSGSTKGTQIYFPFLSKSPSKRIPSRFPSDAQGPYGKRCSYPVPFFTYLPGYPGLFRE